MGKRGPAPEPTVISMLKGNPSKKQFNGGEPVFEPVSGDCPPPAVLEGKAAEVWRDTVARLSSARVLTQADVPVLIRYCITAAQYLACYEKVKVAGEEYTHWEQDPNREPGKLRIKYTQVAPWATQMYRHHAAMLRIEQEFGMTPSSRSQVNVHGSSSPTSPLAQWRARHSAS
jgi:P27 family predicted phage terminase small subunit